MTTNIQKIPLGYKETEIDVIPKDWDVKRFTDCTDLRHGFQFRDRHFSKNGIPVIKIGNLIDGGGLDLLNITFISSQSLGTFKNVILHKGDVLMALTGATLGKISIVDKEEVTVQNYRVGNFFPKKDAEKLFIFYLLQSKFIQSKRKKLVNEAAQPNLGKRDFDKFLVPLPSDKNEQKYIASILWDIDLLLKETKLLIEKKKNVRQGAMQELLAGKRRLPGFCNEWVTKPLQETAWFQEGPGVRASQFTEQGVKLLNGTNIYRGKLLLENTNRFISESEAFGPYSHFMAEDGDIVIASSGVTIDKFEEKIAFVNKEHLPLCMNTSTIRFKVKDNYLISYFLYYFLMSKKFKDQIGTQATGSAQLNFGPAHLEKVEIYLPKEKEEQKAIANILSDMDAEIEKLQSKLKKYQELKQGMMQALLTGKIRLK